MHETIHGVVLHTIKHSDRQNIVHLYTREHGLMAFAVPQGRTARARERNALLMPLSLVECQTRVVPGRELCALREPRRAVPLARIYADPVKSAIALFVGELLWHAIREREQNLALYGYIEQSVRVLERAERGVANFHLCFTYHLATLLGIRPDTDTWAEGHWFDMAGGVFAPAPSGGGHWLRPEQARAVWLLSRMRYANMHRFCFTREQRNQILDLMLIYCRLHHATSGELRSPDVLRQLFV